MYVFNIKMLKYRLQIESPLPKTKPTSSSGLMMPNCTLLMRRNGHALSLEGGPCILSIQRDASSPGTPL